MLSWPTKLLLFISSYLPLWIIFVFLDGTRLDCWIVLPIGAIVAGLVGLWFLGWYTRVISQTPLVVAEAYRIDTDNVAYILTYIFPFVGTALTTQQEAIGFGALFVVVALVYVGADMIYVNPVLTLLGWRVYRIQSKKGNEHIVMTQNKTIKKDETLHVVPLAEGLWRVKLDAGGGSIPASDRSSAD